MSGYFDPITPPDIECHPELPIIETLAHLLEITELTLYAHHPDICIPNWPLNSRKSPPPCAYAASVLLSLVHGLADATRVYRESIARDLIRPQSHLDLDQLDSDTNDSDDEASIPF